VKDIKERHIGDLGNVTANLEGRAAFKLSDHLVKVYDIVGRSVVVAEKEDDFGEGSSPLSKVRVILLDC